MTKIKIIRAVTVSQSLGFCRDIMIQMRQKGYEIIAVSSPGPKLNHMRSIDGFRCIEVPMNRHISPCKDLLSLFRMIKVFIKERPQMIHSMTPKAGLICMLAGWITRVPLRVHTFTGLVWPTSVGLKRRLLMFTDWLTCSCATHIIPEGQGVMSDLHNYITNKPMRVLGFGNCKGVDLEHFNPSRISVDRIPSIFSFLFVGRVVAEKGINELIKAFLEINKKYPFTRLVLVGEYEEALDPIDPITVKQIAVNDNVVMCGAKYDDELLIEYKKADCLVLPSYREGFPNVVIEAGAMGLPSIVTNINGSREIIVDGENGYIVPSKDTEALIDAMEKMIVNEDVRKNMACNARRMVAERFEKSFVQNNQIQFYEELLNSIDTIKD